MACSSTQRFSRSRAAHDRGHRGVVRARLRVGQVDPAVLGVARMDFDVEEAAVLDGPGLRRARDRLGKQAALLDDPQPARPLGDEHAPVGQERDAPRRLEVPRHHLELERLLLGPDHRRRRGRRSSAGVPWPRLPPGGSTPPAARSAPRVSTSLKEAMAVPFRPSRMVSTICASSPPNFQAPSIEAARRSAVEVPAVAGDAMLVVDGPRLAIGSSVPRPARGSRGGLCSDEAASASVAAATVHTTTDLSIHRHWGEADYAIGAHPFRNGLILADSTRSGTSRASSDSCFPEAGPVFRNARAAAPRPREVPQPDKRAPELLQGPANVLTTPIAAEMSTEQWTVRHRT